ncbi:VanZ family protein [Neobacillus sp. 179-J 1A1 HS]|uniref:VanZ family protein n=1 Tax=Neobacillus driksii TaxID=3035913 RepID=UPI0035BBD719
MVNRKWWRLAAAIWMVSIIIVTQLPYFTGQNTAKVIQKAVETEPNTIKTPNADPVDVNELNLIVRKITHVIVFGILAILLYNSLSTYQLPYILSWILTVLYAVSDEWHQSFMPGRVATYRDVLFDSLGAFIALFLTYLISKKRKSTVNK